jgi:hypothetical protein
MAENNTQTILSDASEIIESLDVSEARTLIKSLDSKGITPNQASEAGVLYRQMLFVRLPQLPMEQALWLLQNCVLVGLSMPNFDLLGRMWDALSLVFIEEERIRVAKQYAQAIEAGTENLGSQKLIIDGVEAAPTVQNWLHDYSLWPSTETEKQGLDEINYANKSPNAKKLDTASRSLLLKLLGLCDTFQSNILEYEQLPPIYVEDHPDADFTALSAEPEEFDSGDKVYLSYKQALAPLATNIGAPTPVTTAGRPSVGFPMKEDIEPSAPNIQGVLVKTPLGISSDSGLDVRSTAEVSKQLNAKKDLQQSFNATPGKKNERPSPALVQKSTSAPVGSAASQPKIVPAGPADSSMLPPLVSKPKPQLPPLAAPIMRKPSGQPSLASTLPPLSMDALKEEAQKKKSAVQADIDTKLESLKKRSNKN